VLSVECQVDVSAVVIRPNSEWAQLLLAATRSSAECRVPSAECRVPSAECRVLSVESSVQCRVLLSVKS
jgi:hypothetical protein